MESLVLIFSTSFLIALSGALVPGPMLTVTISGAAEKGFWAGPLVVLGHGILELSLVVLIFLGLGSYLRKPELIGIVGLCGGLALVWLGVATLSNAGRLQLDLEGGRGNPPVNPVLHGALASLSNPYWTLWWATIGMGYLVAALALKIAGIVVFFAGHILADLLWYSAVSFVVSRGRTRISHRFYRGLIRFCGVFLIGFAGWFLYLAWRQWASA